MAGMTGAQLAQRMMAGALTLMLVISPARSAAENMHPRLLTSAGTGRAALQERLQADPDAARRFDAIRARLQPYMERHRTDPAWITSRLQMYWQGKHTEVYVKDSLYVRAEGTAPVPTVRFTGGRDSTTAYATPKLEDVKPYMGENDLLYLQHKSAPGQPWELVPQAKTGRIVESINMRIAELARDAAFLHWYTGDEAYGRFAFDIFDTYMTGIYHRRMPVDLNRAHDQTIVGLQSYEVIHEDIVGPLTETYDFLHAYARQRAGARAAQYDTAFQRWADVILANGVPWNNWNLIKARFVLQIAAVLDRDEAYADRQGSNHYVRAAIDGSGVRQWGLQRLLDAGYDRATGVWNESPAYSVNVVGDYVECLDLLERVFGIDLLPQMPVLERAATVLPQYLLPSGRMVGFGDTRYDYVRTGAIEQLLARASHHRNAADVHKYGRLLAAIRGASGDAASRAKAGEGVHSLFAQAVPAVTASVPVQAFQTPTFFAPNAGWVVQRNGYTAADAGDTALLISQAGSAGNHTHANGIAMELFALGLSLAPESGRGSGYLQNDHLQYYAQFPAHNTVLVDGMSTYPSMKADHPLALNGLYPRSGSPLKDAFPWATFSDVSFVEPATQADQRRVLGTVRLADGSGYFVDVFRSRRGVGKGNGKDKYHDYIYHNLGQSMTFIGADGKALDTTPTQKLSFADGDVFGYDFWSERRALKSTAPLTARFDLALPGRKVRMQAWLQGASNREFFSVEAPPSTAWVPGVLPPGIDKLPLRTLVVRQTGEAWSHPFSSIFEPVAGEGAGIVLGVEEIVQSRALGLRVSTRNGGRQTIVSTDGDDASFVHGDQSLRGRYGIVAHSGDALDYLFLGDGRELAAGAHALAAKVRTAAVLWRQDGHWYASAGGPIRLTVPADWPATLAVALDGRQHKITGTLRGNLRSYELPAMPATRLR